MNINEKAIYALFDKWIAILRIRNNWDVRLELVYDENFKKTGDLKIDCDDKKAIIILNARNPKQENFEEVICHELLHLKMYPLDQFTESLILSTYEDNETAKNLAYYNFFTSLEITVEELTKCYLGAFGENKELSYGRCRGLKSYNDLYEGLKPLG